MSVEAITTAASNALPPFRRMFNPASVAIGWAVETMPLVPTAEPPSSGVEVGGGAVSHAAASTPNATETKSFANRMVPKIPLYSEVLGLESAFDLDWVDIYKLSPTSSVGLVNASGGAHKPSSDKPVMVSMVVEETDVDAWWDYLKSKGVDVGDGPRIGADGHVKVFGFKDPEGYSLEVFAWLDNPK